MHLCMVNAYHCLCCDKSYSRMYVHTYVVYCRLLIVYEYNFICNVHVCIVDNMTCLAADDFRCESSGACIRRAQVCDRVLHCSDGSDETNCSKFM